MAGATGFLEAHRRRASSMTMICATRSQSSSTPPSRSRTNPAAPLPAKMPCSPGSPPILAQWRPSRCRKQGRSRTTEPTTASFVGRTRPASNGECTTMLLNMGKLAPDPRRAALPRSVDLYRRHLRPAGGLLPRRHRVDQDCRARLRAACRPISPALRSCNRRPSGRRNGAVDLPAGARQRRQPDQGRPLYL